MPDSDISAGPPETGAKGILMKKIGPLPLVAWVLIGVGSAAAIIYLRNRNKPAASPNGVSATGASTGVPASTTPYDVQVLTDAISNMEKLLAGQSGNTTVNSGTTTAAWKGSGMDVVRGLNNEAYISPAGTGNWSSIGGLFASNTFQVNQNSSGQTIVTGIGLNNAPWVNTQITPDQWSGWKEVGGLVNTERFP